MSQQPIILALTDGKAGHETQTQGIVQLLNQQQQYQVEWLKLNFPSKWQYRVLKWLIKFHLNTSWLTSFMTSKQIEDLKQKNVAYIVSAGGNTLLANALLKQELIKTSVVKNIVASSLRGMKPDYFDVVFTIQPEQENLASYLYYPIAPNKMCALPLTQAQARLNLGLEASDQVITVLIGADTRTVGIGSAEEWGEILQNIRIEYPEACILLTTSRRTPLEFEQTLMNYCEQHNILNNSDQMTWVAQGQQCDIKDYILAADWVLASQDSTSMMAEVMMANKRLLIHSFPEKLCNENIRVQLRELEMNGWLYSTGSECIIKIVNDLQQRQHLNHAENLFTKLINKLAIIGRSDH